LGIGRTVKRRIFVIVEGDHLKVSPIHSYAANGAGLTTSFANANVIPTLDLAVLMPVKSKFEEEVDQDTVGMVGGKDYLNGRYFDVSKMECVQIVGCGWLQVLQ
jgi:hypothetical protein